MSRAPLPPNEEARLRAVRETRLLDTAPEADFDELTFIASEICATPIALVTLVDAERQWWKSSRGLDGRETPRESAFCAHAILDPQVLEIHDAAADPRFFDNPFVTGPAHVRFYAGAPLVNDEGLALGSLCVIDLVPRTLTATQRAALEALARQVVRLVALRQQREALRASNEELVQSEARFRLLAERSRELIVRYDAAGTRLYVSPASRELLGYEPHELVGERAIDVVHPDDAPAIQDVHKRMLRGEDSATSAAYRSRRKDGTYVWFETSVRAIRDDATGALVEVHATTRDISAAKTRERLLTAQHTLSQMLAASAEIRELAPRLLSTLCAAVDWEVGALWEVDVQDAVLRCEGTAAAHADAFPRIRAVTTQSKYARGEGLPGRVWATGAAVDIAAIASAKDFDRAAEAVAEGLSSAFALPLVADGEIIGVLELFRRDPAHVDAATRVAIEALSSLLGLFLIRKRTQESRERLALVLESTSDFVGISDGRGRALYLNRAGREMLGIPVAAEIGDYALSEYQPDWATKRLVDEVVPSAVKAGMWKGELAYRAVSGREIPVSQVTIAQKNARGTVDFFASVARDISELKKVERMKSEFVSTVSHELRTPLTSIRGALGLLHGGVLGALPPQAVEIVTIAFSNCERLIRLINDMLDLDKIEAGQLELHRRDVLCEELAKGAVDGVRAMAQAAGVTVEQKGLAGVPIHVDPDRVVQVLINLLSNAIKFSPTGGAVTLRMARRASRLRFLVTDRGPGIDPAHLDKLFRKFQQLDSSDTRAKGGTGLGLAISKAIVEQHGGEIGVETTVGAGTTFWFELDAFAEHSRSTGVTPSERRHRAGNGEVGTVLLVDDDPSIRTVLSRQLAALGLRVIEAADGDDAVFAARASLPDLIVLDVGMPRSSGFEVVEVLRREATRTTPLLIYSGRELGLAERERLTLGVTRYITKARASEEEFLLSVRELLRDGRASRGRG